MATHLDHRAGAERGYDKPIPDIISQIKDSYADLRPAERRVADAVLADVAFSVDASNAEIARRAAVSGAGCCPCRSPPAEPARSGYRRADCGSATRR